MKADSVVERDIEQIGEFFPKLNVIDSDKSIPLFQGEIDISDENGIYWKTFSVKIIAPKEYPFGVPKMQETSNHIKRIADQHIDSNGWCCVALPHELEIRASRGLTIFEYLREYAYPYLANQVFFQASGRYAGFEYKHGIEGVKQFYHDVFKTTDNDIIKRFLIGFLKQQLPKYIDKCWCGSTRSFRKCHLLSVNQLKNINKERIKFDIQHL